MFKINLIKINIININLINILFGDLGLAHLVEQLIVPQEVAGSIPASQNVLYWQTYQYKRYYRIFR